MTAINTQDDYDCFLGFDVAKDSITVFDSRTGKYQELPNRPAAIARFLRGYDQRTYAVCEPTGGYETILLDALQQAAITTHRADTIRVKNFIRSLGKIAKTDAIDAMGLARYAQERWRELLRWSARSTQIAIIQALVQRRIELLDMRVAESNRAKGPAAARIAASLRSVLAVLSKQIKQIERQIEETFLASSTLTQIAAALQSVPGIGRLTACTLYALMPEIGTLSTKQAAALAGLAPHPKDSGTIAGYRRIRGGRPQVRKALFMPAMAATRSHSPIADFYKDLIARGKKPRLAIVAVMRKIVVIANARARDAIIQQQS
jgi:transposase